MKKTSLFVLLLVCVMLVTSCGPANNNLGESTQKTVTGTVSHDTKYNAALTSLTPENMESAGINLGDSLDVEFENGFKLTDVPYYNGYYVKNEAPVVVAYPGFGDVRITYNNLGIWDNANLKEGEKVTITLNEAGKYSAIQESLGQQYSFERKDYTTDEEFCNFRALTGGNLKENFLYRGASPLDDSRGRASYTDGLLSDIGVTFVIDLADSEEDVTGYATKETFNSPYTKDLYDNGHVALLDMSSAFQSETYQMKVAEGFKQLIQKEVATGFKLMMSSGGPVYIHCMEGKDRTGFVCMLLEALAGASYEEMRNDYMITYKNYFKVSKEETPEKYDAIADLYFDSFMAYLHGTEDKKILKNANYVDDAKNYLMSAGMTTQEIDAFIDFITK